MSDESQIHQDWNSHLPDIVFIMEAYRGSFGFIQLDS
jgi:hypothetical protein